MLRVWTGVMYKRADKGGESRSVHVPCSVTGPKIISKDRQTEWIRIPLCLSQVVLAEKKIF